MAHSISAEKIQDNERVIFKLIKKFDEPLQTKMEQMLQHGNLDYFMAPASSRTEFHGCYVGGLADHSLRVTVNLQNIANALAPGKYDIRTLVFLGLVHDLGKAGDVGVPMYIDQPSSWHREKGMLYEINKDLLYMPICDRTMYTLQKFGITLTDEQFVAIRISDGPYEKCNEKYAMKEPDLALLLHFADRWACAQEKQSE